MLSYTIDQLIKKLESMDVKAYIRGDGVKNLVQSMHSIRTLALYAETQHKQLGTNGFEVKIWLKKLKDALDDIMHLLNDFSTQDLRHQNKKDKKVKIFSSLNQLAFSFKMTNKIKALTKRIKGLRKFSNFDCHPCEQLDPERGETHSFIHEENFIGREEEKKDLMKLLLNTNNIINEENISLIFINGDEGIGKTALAQLVYNDKEVQRHFELKNWVWVSKLFNINGICAKIIEDMDTNIVLEHESKGNNIRLEDVSSKLSENIDGKRYLLVLDDVSNESYLSWSNLMKRLKGAAKGSKIIITTRSKKVAKISKNRSQLITLEKLNEEHSWRMFCLFAFNDETELENQNLVSIGKEIVQKCNGIPLSIYRIGRLMYTKKTEKDWLKLKDQDLVNIDELGLLALYEEDLF